MDIFTVQAGNPIIFWRDWWNGLAIFEQTFAIIIFVMAIFVLIVSPALADVDNFQINNVWTVLIIAVLGPAVLLWMKDRSERRERIRVEEREDAREARMEARAAEAQRLITTRLETIQKNTDGVLTQVAALAKAAGHIEGTKEATQKAEDTATTLALGQQQGRDAERESIASKPLVTKSDTLISVADARTASASERVADATERSADAAQRVDKVTEEKKI